ncbi:hypothetical protein [Bacillus sp. CGMCC 1.16541]|nr:hypothetical protein [Bacillus sp. CGMCC 1.16541]
MEISPSNEQICLEYTLCAPVEEFFITWIAVFILYLGYRYIYQK